LSAQLIDVSCDDPIFIDEGGEAFCDLLADIEAAFERDQQKAPKRRRETA
jgi:hypothetical protein